MTEVLGQRLHFRAERTRAQSEVEVETGFRGQPGGGRAGERLRDPGVLASSLMCDAKGCAPWVDRATSLGLLINKIRLLQLCCFSRLAKLGVL